MSRLALAVLAVLTLLTGCAATAEVVGRAPPRGVEVLSIELPYSNAFLIRSARPVLVDSGSPGDEVALREALAKRGVRFEDIALVVLTHGHADHAGAAAAIRSATGARIVLGKGDLPMTTRGHNTTMKWTSLFALALRPFVDFPYSPFEPDVVLESSPLDLAPYGIAGKVEPMAGHTPGSLVVVLDNRTAFVGDQMLGGAFGGAINPRFPGEHYYQEDVAQNHRNVEVLLDRGIETFYLGHGGPVKAWDVRQELGETRR